MNLYELLSETQNCDFNGYLVDYLKIYQPMPKYADTFNALIKFQDSWRLIVNYRFDLSTKSATNKIIHYKDLHKLPKKAFRCPFIAYSKDEKGARAIIFSDNYIIAKGLYLSLSEKGNIFENYRNEIIVMNFSDYRLLKNMLKQLYTKKAGYLQRIIDHQMFNGYDEMFAEAKTCAIQMTSKLKNELNVCSHKEKIIAEAICHWFLLKKCVYVEYMVNKEILKKRHHNDQNLQRTQAKTNADAIQIIPYAKMWNGLKDKES